MRKRDPQRVYFIRPIGMKGPVKIGCSISPDGRRDTLAQWSPFPLEIVAEIAGDQNLERRFHAKFYDQHKSREWFDWSPELQAVIDAVIAGAFDISTLPAKRGLKSMRGRKKWSEESRINASYGRRLRTMTNKTGRHPPRGFRRYQIAQDPKLRAIADAFLADPIANGISWDELYPPEERERDRLRIVEWHQAHGKPIPEHALKAAV